MKFPLMAVSLLISTVAFADAKPCVNEAEKAAVALYKTTAPQAKIDAGIESKARLEGTYDEYSDYVVGVASKATSGDWEATYTVTVQLHEGQCDIVYTNKIK